MKRRFALLTAAAALGTAITGCASTGPASGGAAPAAPAPKLHAAMRELWQGHIAATRNYALAVHAGDAAGAQRAEAAVVVDARQIVQAVAGFYGAGDGTLRLLGGHWGGVKALTNAAKAGNATAEDGAMSKLVGDAGEIARFFAGTNPKNWTERQLQGALPMHAGDHKQQVDAMMGNAPAAQQAALWADMQHHMDMIADVPADGIARQFPDEVSRTPPREPRGAAGAARTAGACGAGIRRAPRPPCTARAGQGLG